MKAPRSMIVARWVTGTVAAALISAALIAPVTAHVGNDFGHLWGDHIKPKLANTSGNINQANNPVDWAQLKNVPQGLADGTDDISSGGGGGDITSVIAQDGLKGGGTAGDVALEVDTSVIQSRVASGCGLGPGGSLGGSSIRSIQADGQVICEPDDAAWGYGGFNDGPKNVPASMSSIGSLDLPSGMYVIFAKLWIQTDLAGDSSIDCKLTAGGDFDEVQIYLQSRDAGYMGMNVLHNFSAEGKAVVSCGLVGSSNPNTKWLDLKISAIRVNALSNKALP